MEDTQGFRFLDLPKDIRLEIYDLFPTETRRYTVQIPDTPTHTPFTLVLERIPCMELLTTCRQIFHEVSAVLGSRLDGQPLRIFTNARDLCDTAVHVMANYTSSDPQNESMKIHIKRYIPSRQSGSKDQDVPKVPPQALRHNITATGSKLEVEIALELGGLLRETSRDLRLMKDYIRIFYEWIVDMGQPQYSLYDPVNVTIRPKPTADVSEKTASDGQVFDFEQYQKDFGPGKMWTCQLGECMTEKEWQRNWEEGKHFGKLKRI